MSEPVLTHGATPFEHDVGWALHAPSSPEGELPLVVALHGMSQNGAWFARRLAPLLDDRRFILFPDGPLPFEVRRDDESRREGRAWYIYTGDQEGFIASALTTGRWLMKLIEEIAAAHPIDRDRVTILGYSQGGYLAGILAPRHRDRIAALVSLSSRVKAEAVPEGGAEGLRVLVVHGADDPLVSPDAARDAASTLEELGALVTFESVAGGHRTTPEHVRVVREWLEARGL